MKKMLSYLLVMVLLVSCVPLAITPALAVGIPGDTDEDDELTEAELTSAILSYMLGEEGALDLNELRDAAHVYVYWDGEPRTITDSADREVTIYKPIKRVVCTLSHHIEALRILKVSKDKIVGVPSGYLDPYFFPEFDDVPGIGHLAWEADIEAILALYPDVVLLPAAPGPFETTADEEQELLEDAGLTVLRLTFNQPEMFTEELENSGYIFEKEEEAEEFIDWHDDILNSIVEKTSEIPDGNKTKVYSEYYTYPPYTVTTADDDIIATAGGKDIFEGLNAEVSAEDVIFEDPEIIISAVYREEGYGLDTDDTAALEEVRDDVMSREGLQGVLVVETGSVYIITSHVWTYLPYSGCRPLIGLCYLAKWFHPELFDELDPKAIHQEYLTRFQGLDVDLDENGVFVYPE
jgi:iron complex transport system substrate-binding protein